MKKKMLLGLGVVVPLVAPFVGGPSAWAAPTTCTGTITGHIDGSIVVPDAHGASTPNCTLEGAAIGGSVTVQPGGNLLIHNGTHIGGGLTATQPGAVNINSFNGNGQIGPQNSIGGSMTIDGDSGPRLGFACALNIGGSLTLTHIGTNSDGYGVNLCDGIAEGPVRVGGSVRMTDNYEEMELRELRVGGSMTVANNPDTGPGTEISGNTIGGTLQCSNLAAVSNYGEVNRAARKAGQCANL